MMIKKRFRISVSVLAVNACLLSSCALPQMTIVRPYDMAVQEEKADTDTDILPGSDLAQKNSSWGVYTESGGSASFDVSNKTLTLKIASPGKVGHAVQLYCDRIKLIQGAAYRFSAEISSDTDRYFEWRIQINGGDYHPYADLEKVCIGPDPVTVSSDFTMEYPTDPAARMCFNLGDAKSEQKLGAHNIYIRNISLVMTDDSGAVKEEDMREEAQINLNQIGYRPGDEKRAVIRSESDKQSTFTVTSADTGESVYEGRITDGITFGSSGDRVSYADFSELTKPGRYRVVTDNKEESYEFTIADDVYEGALVDSQKMFYLQRCGMDLDEEYAGDFAHRACHTDEARVYGGTRYVDVSGGWHDAGDYGRYTVPAAKAVADLLLSYELFPDSFSDDNGIPESGNGIPDILDEARYELEWLFKMQQSDGGVCHKVTGLDFDGFVMPEDCKEPLYLFPESKTATADFAGVMYMAGRVYRDIDEGFSAKCIACADRAVDAYLLHRDDANFTNPADVNTGEYGDGCSVDEFLWAICEGYRTTQDKRFSPLLETVDLSKIKNDGFGWEDMSGYAYYAYMSTKNPMKTKLDLEGRFFAMCDELKSTALSGEAYGCTITSDYPWGSNMTVANNGMALLLARSITGNADYERAAKRQLDYLFGTNACSYCFLTGYGTQSPNDPHHRPSVALKKCMKGMLVGGPDSYLEDPYAKAVLSGLPKAKCYVDSMQSYSCNEITIYWNSPLVFLLAGLK